MLATSIGKNRIQYLDYKPIDVASTDPHYLGVKRAKCVRKSHLYLTVISHLTCFKNIYARILENDKVFQNLFSADM